MMNKIKKLLKSKKGDVGFIAIAVLLIIILIFSVSVEYLKALTIIQSVSDSLQQSVISCATNNAYNAFHGVREGNSAAYLYGGEGMGWQEIVTTDDVERKLVSVMSLKKQGSYYVKKNDEGGTNFRISNIQVDYANVNVGHKGNSYTLSFSASCDLEVPYMILGQNVPFTKKVILHSTYIPLF